MLLLNDIISDNEISEFKQYFSDHFDKKYVNWSVDQDVIDHRSLIDKNSDLFTIIQRIVGKNFSNPIKCWAAYQRQSRPHNIHIDDYSSDMQNSFRYTYILAMDSVPEFKAIIWKEKCWDNNKLHEFVQQWGKMKRFKKPNSNISETQDLEHTYDTNQQAYMADYLTLDGIYTYQTGTACLFDATQLHCTSNWVKYNKFPYRELLQIHVVNSQPIDC
jgi:hypothetical protein